MWNQKKQDRCEKLKRQRSKYYARRSSLKKKISSVSPDSKKFKAMNKRLVALDKKIDSFKPKIFKCGKRYHKLVVSRTKLINANSYLRKKLRKEGLSDKEKRSIRNKIGRNNDKIRELSSLMNKDFVVTQGKIETFMGDQFYQERLPIWQVSEMVENAVDSDRFNAIYIDGDGYPLPMDKPMALFALGDYIDEIQNTQYKREVKTPMLWITLDEAMKVITVSLEQI